MKHPPVQCMCGKWIKDLSYCEKCGLINFGCRKMVTKGKYYKRNGEIKLDRPELLDRNEISVVEGE